MKPNFKYKDYLNLILIKKKPMTKTNAHWVTSFSPQILVILVLCLLFYAVLEDLYLFKFKRLPPGPLSLPVIGGLHLLGREPYKSVLKMSAKYGDLFSLRLGMRERVVYVVDPEIMKQVFFLVFLTYLCKQIFPSINGLFVVIKMIF